MCKRFFLNVKHRWNEVT